MNNARDASGRVGSRKKDITVMVSPTCIFRSTITSRRLLFREGERWQRRGRLSLSAGCLSAWGEEEADKWEWVGVETEWERRREDLSVICLI